MLNIAAAVMEPSMDAMIPDTLEQAKGILIFDCEAEKPIPQFYAGQWAKAMIDTQCEALLCGFIYNAPLFEAIADAGITRYFAAGYTVREAVEAMDARQLGMIRDYVGSPGHSHEHHHHHDDEEGDCDGQCQSCSQACAMKE